MNTTVKPFHDFKATTIIEQQNRAILEEKVYPKFGNNKVNTDLELQKLGIDVFLKTKTGNKVCIDEKIIQKDYNFNLFQMFEMDNIWNNTDERYKPGWAIDDELRTDWLVMYCVAAKKVFIYDFKKLRAYAKTLKDYRTYPKWNSDGTQIYAPKVVANFYIYTVCIYVPRSFIKDCLIEEIAL